MAISGIERSIPLRQRVLWSLFPDKSDITPILSRDTNSSETITQLDPNPEALLKLTQLSNLKKSNIVLLGGISGAGHEFVRKTLESAIDPENSKHMHVISMSDNFSATKISTFFKENLNWVLEGAQRSMFLQQIGACPVRTIQIIHDIVPTLITMKDYLEKVIENEVVIVSTHYESAAVIGLYRKQLEEKFNKKIFIVLQMTDFIYNPQTPWYLMDVDVLIVPDEKASKVAIHEFERWEKLMKHQLPADYHRPLIIINDYPIHEAEIKPLNKEKFEYRCAQLDPTDLAKARIIFGMSGSSVQTKFILPLIDNLLHIKSNKKMDIGVIHNQNKSPDRFNQALKEFADKFKIRNLATNSTNDQVKQWIQEVAETVVAIGIFKPSEKIAYLLAHPEQFAGLIALLTYPIGQQEIDNEQAMVDKGLLPTPQQMHQLQLILSDSTIDNEQRIELLKMFDFFNLSHKWRGLKLPYDKDKSEIQNAIDSARFIKNALETGLLFEMVKNFETKLEDMPPTGAGEIWKKINDIMPELVAQRVHDALTLPQTNQ